MKTAEDYFERHWDNWPVNDLTSYDATKVNCVKLMQEYADQQLAEYKEKLKEKLMQEKTFSGSEARIVYEHRVR